MDDTNSPGFRKNKRLVVNVSCCEYDVIKKVARKVQNFKLKEIEEDAEGRVINGEGG